MSSSRVGASKSFSSGGLSVAGGAMGFMPLLGVIGDAGGVAGGAFAGGSGAGAMSPGGLISSIGFASGLGSGIGVGAPPVFGCSIGAGNAGPVSGVGFSIGVDGGDDGPGVIGPFSEPPGVGSGGNSSGRSFGSGAGGDAAGGDVPGGSVAGGSIPGGRTDGGVIGAVVPGGGSGAVSPVRGAGVVPVAGPGDAAGGVGFGASSAAALLALAGFLGVVS